VSAEQRPAKGKEPARRVTDGVGRKDVLEGVGLVFVLDTEHTRKEIATGQKRQNGQGQRKSVGTIDAPNRAYKKSGKEKIREETIVVLPFKSRARKKDRAVNLCRQARKKKGNHGWGRQQEREFRWCGGRLHRCGGTPQGIP